MTVQDEIEVVLANWLQAGIGGDSCPTSSTGIRLQVAVLFIQTTWNGDVFCAVEPKAGIHFAFPTPNRSAPELALALDKIISGHPFNRDSVMDNFNIHCRKTLTDHFGKKLGAYLWSLLTVHYTPKYGTWLNQAEIEDQPVRPPVSGQTHNSDSGRVAARNAGLELQDKSRPGEDQFVSIDRRRVRSLITHRMFSRGQET